MLLGVGGMLSLAPAMRAYERSRGRIDPAFPAVRSPAGTGRAARALDFLLLGVDDTAHVAGSPAGMIALVHVRADRKGVVVLSVPHSTAVPVAGHREGPIGESLSLGGVPLAVQCVEELLEVHVDHVAVLPLTGLAALTDALGGVTVHNGSAFVSDGIDFPTGRQPLDGERAAAFVRCTGSDAIRRVDAEHAFLHGLIEQLLGPGAHLERDAIRAVASDVFPRLATDPGLDGAALARLALALRGLHSEDVHLRRLPIRLEPPGGAEAPIVRPEGLTSIRRGLRDDALEQAGQ